MTITGSRTRMDDSPNVISTNLLVLVHIPHFKDVQVTQVYIYRNGLQISNILENVSDLNNGKFDSHIFYYQSHCPKHVV